MATITLTTEATNAARVAAAFGLKLGLPGNASVAQIKADLMAYVAAVVEDQERLAAVKAQQQAKNPLVQT